METRKQKNEGIQVLRAILLVGIVAFHTGIPGSQLLWGGVEAFFVISAYFFSKKFYNTPARQIKIITQVKHRFIRLYPVYILMLLCIVLIKNSFEINDFLFHMLFSQNINWMLNGYNSNMSEMTGHTWTLSIEIYLFIIWLVAYKCLWKKSHRIIFNVQAIIIAIAWRVITVLWIADPMVTSLCPIAHMDAYALGALLVYVDSESNDKNKRLFKHSCLILGLIIIIFSVCFTAQNSECSIIEAYRLHKTSETYLGSVYTCNLYLGFSLVTVGLVLTLKNISVHRVLTPLVMIGNVSYSAYLIHYPLNRKLFKVTDNRWIIFAITFIFSVILAWIIDTIIYKIKHKIKKRDLLKEKNDTTF